MGVPMGEPRFYEDWETFNHELFAFSIARMLRWAKTHLTD